MAKKRTNNGPLRESADKHSIYSHSADRTMPKAPAFPMYSTGLASTANMSAVWPLPPCCNTCAISNSAGTTLRPRRCREGSRHVSMADVHGHPQPIPGAQRDGHFRDDRVLGHHLECVGLGYGRQDQVHFHEGERFANTSPRPFAKRD